MSKNISFLLFAFLTALLVTFASAQEKKTAELQSGHKIPRMNYSGCGTKSGNKLITMAEDFPEEQYKSSKPRRNERTFGEKISCTLQQTTYDDDQCDQKGQW